MAPVTYKVKLTRPQVFLWRMSLFLILAALLAIILDGQTQQLRKSFLANPGLNALHHECELDEDIWPGVRDELRDLELEPLDPRYAA